MPPLALAGAMTISYHQMVMSSRPRRVGVAEAKAHFADVVRAAGERRTIIQRRGKDVAVVLGVDELARLDAARATETAGARLLAALARVRRRHGGVDDFEPERAVLTPQDPFAGKARRR